jgi:hypothetical protein
VNMAYIVDSVENVVGHRYVIIIITWVLVSIVPFQIKTIRNFVKYVNVRESIPTREFSFVRGVDKLIYNASNMYSVT